MKYIKFAVKIAVLFIVVINNVSAQAGKIDEKREKFDPARNPFSDLKAAVELAEKQNKNIILDVGGEWCIWCHRLDEFINNHTVLKNYIKEHFVTVKVNYSEENKNEKFLSAYPKIPGYPHLFVLSRNGELLHSQNTGLLEKGKSYSEKKILVFLKKWSAKK